MVLATSIYYIVSKIKSLNRITILLHGAFVFMLFSPKGRFRKLLKHPLLRGGVMTTLALFTVGNSYAISPTIPASKADSLSSKQIIYRDRVAPFNTMSRDIIQKIYGESSYEGLICLLSTIKTNISEITDCQMVICFAFVSVE